MRPAGPLRSWVRRTPWARAVLAPPWIALVATVERARAAFKCLRRPVFSIGSLSGVLLQLAARRERVVLDWAFGRGGNRGYVRRVIGGAALRVVDLYYRREFRRLTNATVLPASAFDPNLAILVIGSLGPGGAERQLVETLLGIQRTGKFRLALICTSLQEPWQRFFLPRLQASGLEVIELHQDGSEPSGLNADAAERFRRAFAHLPPSLGDIRDYGREFALRRPGIVHLWLDEINCKAGLAALAVGVPRIILSTRSVAPYHFGLYHQYMAEAYRQLAARAHVTLLNNSAAGAADYGAWLGLAPDRVRVVHNGFHFDALPGEAELHERRNRYRSERLWPQEAPVLGTIIRFTEEKRPDLWVSVALRVAEERADMRFLLVGDGPMRSACEALVGATSFADRFHFAGYQQDTVSALTAMDVFLLTSRKEGLPNVLIEAQALGVPVVSTNAGGAAETFLPGRSGVLAVSDDPTSLTNAIFQIVDNPHVTQAFRMEAARQARQRFGVDRMIRETSAFYESSAPIVRCGAGKESDTSN